VMARELERQGQVFWVHNRVQGLEAVAERVAALAPGARVDMAHGQMPERRLEEAVRKFWHGETDILVCTAIIESGLDFPRANTLVVDNAQGFGLGQLYQLRGRVGRSDRQAYAYFLIPSLRTLSETSRKRLQVILDMDYLGAGFQVAMEDLRLRGAGNILGEVQSGNIAKVGLDLFLEMLEDEVRRLKGEKMTQDTDPELSIHFGANLPEAYVTEPRDRMRYYKALSSARSHAALADLEGELRDRFGPLPVEAERFIAVLGFKRILAGLQVARAELYPNRAVLHWSEQAAAVSPDRLVAWVQERAGTARFSPPGSLELRIPEKTTIRQGVRWMESQLAGLPGPEDATHVS
jgi:transcription-repair coupling factor (superfamily II helicase)